MDKVTEISSRTAGRPVVIPARHRAIITGLDQLVGIGWFVRLSLRLSLRLGLGLRLLHLLSQLLL